MHSGRLQEEGRWSNILRGIALHRQDHFVFRRLMMRIGNNIREFHTIDRKERNVIVLLWDGPFG